MRAVVTHCIKCMSIVPTCNLESPSQIHWLGPTTSPASKTVPDFAFPTFTTALKRSALTARCNTAQQCSARTTAGPRCNQRPSHLCFPPALCQNLNIPTRILPRPVVLLPRKLFPLSSKSRTHDFDRTTTSTPNPTCSGTKYTVGAQDTCQSISVAKSIAIDRLIIDNNLDYNCTTLKAGNTLCLGATCALQTVTNNQTCQDITNGQNYTSVQLVSWNP